MGNPKNRKPAKASSRKKTTDAPSNDTSPRWKKPFIWIGTIILTAMAGALTGAFHALFTWVIGAFTPDPPKIGDPITAVVSLKTTTMIGVSLPRPQALSDKDLENLQGMSSEQQVKWLQENREGVPLATYELRMDLKSNRPYTVRVTDIRPVSTCEEPSRGSLVKTIHGGIGMATTSIVFRLYADKPDSGPLVSDPRKIEEEPFFPNRTITLTGEEREYLVLNLEPSETKLCRAEVELTVVDGEEEVHQRISPGAQVPLLPLGETSTFASDYSSVYLAGGICKRPVLAPETYHANVKHSDVEAACGPGNVGPELTSARRPPGR